MYAAPHHSSTYRTGVTVDRVEPYSTEPDRLLLLSTAHRLPHGRQDLLLCLVEAV